MSEAVFYWDNFLMQRGVDRSVLGERAQRMVQEECSCRHCNMAIAPRAPCQVVRKTGESTGLVHDGCCARYQGKTLVGEVAVQALERILHVPQLLNLIAEQREPGIKPRSQPARAKVAVAAT